MRLHVLLGAVLFGLNLFAATEYPPKGGTYEYPLDIRKAGFTLPQITEPQLNGILRSSRTVFYKLPQVYQAYNPEFQRKVYDPEVGASRLVVSRERYGVFPTSYLPDYNANLVFPWDTTLGLHSAEKAGNSPYSAINFLSLPKNKPIVILGNEKPVKWVFPLGAIVGEMVFVADSQKRKYVFEIRTRTKTGDAVWDVNIYRPVGTKEELNKILGIRPVGDSAKKYLFLRNPEEDEVMRLEGFVERLPYISDANVRYILTQKPFKNVTQHIWSEVSTVPMSDKDFDIFPKDYSLGLLSVDKVSCANCHRQTQISVGHLVPNEPVMYNNPTKVGNIRGCDGIFTWHPFDQDAVQKDENTRSTLHGRRYDFDNHIVEHYNPRLHTGYKFTSYVQEALAPFEWPSSDPTLLSPSIKGLNTNFYQSR